MFYANRRVIEHEILDDLPPHSAEASLRDLVRINRLGGGHEVLRKRLRELVNPAEVFTLLDVGAASGDMGDVVREEYPKAVVTSLDYRISHLRMAREPRIVADAFRLPFRLKSFDYVHCSLFLHHFKDEELIPLLRDFGALARRAIVLTDLERHALAFYALPFSRWIFGWDAVTLHDGPISVQAAFTAEELRNLAQKAGLREIDVRVHRPAFRLSLVASGGGSNAGMISSGA